MIIRKKEIKPLCDQIAALAGPFGFYDPEKKPLYVSAQLQAQERYYEVTLGDRLAGYLDAPSENIAAVTALLKLYLKDLEEKRSLTHHTLQKYKELNFLAEISLTLSSSIELDETLRQVTLKINQILETENSSIMLIDQTAGKLFLKVASGRVVNEHSWLSSGGGIPCKVIAEGKAVITNEPEKHHDFVPGGRIAIHSLMCVPLKGKDKIVGILNISNKKSGMFTSEDEALLTSVSVMIAETIENSRLVEEKIKTEKFATIGQMAAGIIHDIKNPMTTIKGFAGLMGDMEFSSEERKEYSKVICDEVDRLVGMVEDLLTFSRGLKTKLEIAPVRVEGFFAEVLPYFEKDMALRSIKLVPRLEYKDNFFIDSDRFKRVVFNIAGNAKEAMHSGGSFLVQSRPADGMVEIVFADTGGGIPADIIDTIFEPFVTKGKKSGTGLGLAITKKIVEEHGGSIKAVNGNYSGVEGFGGANFVIRMPMEPV